MTHSFSQVYVHIIFHVKDEMSLINPEDDNELYKYIGGLIKISKSIPIQINGTEDHIHILCVISKNISLANLLEDIKTKSSRWIKTKGNHYRYFQFTNSQGSLYQR
jgi:REP element-mobilizing transposase RayT